LARFPDCTSLQEPSPSRQDTQPEGQALQAPELSMYAPTSLDVASHRRQMLGSFASHWLQRAPESDAPPEHLTVQAPPDRL
jgi:hypothetical protein